MMPMPPPNPLPSSLPLGYTAPRGRVERGGGWNLTARSPIGGIEIYPAPTSQQPYKP